MADVDVAHIETALAHPANGLMNRTVGGAPTDHRELSALLAEAHLLRCDGVGDAEHLVGAHFRHRLMVRRVIVDMASAHILLDTPYPVHQARRARLDPDAQIGRAHVCTPVTNAHLVCRLQLEKKTGTDPRRTHRNYRHQLPTPG